MLFMESARLCILVMGSVLYFSVDAGKPISHTNLSSMNASRPSALRTGGQHEIGPTFHW